MKKKILNKVLSGASIGYLIFFIVVLIKLKVNAQKFEILDADGLAIIGGIVALLELILSNRNAVSKWFNKLYYFNKSINYRVFIVFNSKNLTPSIFLQIFEAALKEYMEEPLSRVMEKKPTNSNIKVKYNSVGCEVQCKRHVYEDSKSDTYGFEISGITKYGSITTRRKDILYFASLIKILSNDFLTNEQITNNSRFERMDVKINRIGSQISWTNVFNEYVADEVVQYEIGLKNNNKEEIRLNNNEAEWSILDRKKILDGFEKLTDVLCSIE